MGIQGLLKVFSSVQTDKHLNDYKNQTIAVDTYCWIHKAIYLTAQALMTNSDPSSFIPIVLSYIESLLTYRIKPIMIFDGGKLLSKAGEETCRENTRYLKQMKALELLNSGDCEAAYKKYAESVDVSPDLAYLLLKVIKSKYQLTCIISPYEADAQLAYLSKIGYVDAIITEDSDLLCFGAKKILYKLNTKGYLKEIQLKDWQNCKEFDLKEFDFDQFLSLCIISGCDYLPSLKSIGLKTAYKEFKTCRNIEVLFKKWKMNSKMDFSPEYEEKFYKAFLTFKFQRVFCPIKRKLVNVNELNLEKFEEILKESMNVMSLGKILQNPDVLSPIMIKKLKEFIEKDEGLEFLGNSLDDKTACEIADGVINPITLQPYDEKIEFTGFGKEKQNKSREIVRKEENASNSVNFMNNEKKMIFYNKNDKNSRFQQDFSNNFHNKGVFQRTYSIKEVPEKNFKEIKKTANDTNNIKLKVNFFDKHNKNDRKTLENENQEAKKINNNDENTKNTQNENNKLEGNQDTCKETTKNYEEPSKLAHQSINFRNYLNNDKIKNNEEIHKIGKIDENPISQRTSFETRKEFFNQNKNSFVENIKKRALENASRIKPSDTKPEYSNQESKNPSQTSLNQLKPPEINEILPKYMKKPFQKEISTYFNNSKNEKNIKKDPNESDFSLHSKKRSPFVKKTNGSNKKNISSSKLISPFSQHQTKITNTKYKIEVKSPNICTNNKSNNKKLQNTGFSQKISSKSPLSKEKPIMSYFKSPISKGKSMKKHLSSNSQRSSISKENLKISNKKHHNSRLKTPEMIDKQSLKRIMKKNPLKRSPKEEILFEVPVRKIVEIPEIPKVWEIVEDLHTIPIKVETIIKEFKVAENGNLQRTEQNYNSRGFFNICSELFKPMFH